jgi:hypothetical protein
MNKLIPELINAKIVCAYNRYGGIHISETRYNTTGNV